MPITRSAKKAHRSSLNKGAHNSRRKSAADKAVKSLKKMAALGKKKEAEKLMQAVHKSLDKAVKGGTLNKNTASRRKSRLSKLIKRIA